MNTATPHTVSTSTFGKDFLSLKNINKEEFFYILYLAKTLKQKWRQGVQLDVLRGKALAMFFEKPSLRTRATFDLAMYQLGGHAVALPPQTVQVGQRESLQDSAHCLSRWFTALVIRTFGHDTLCAWAEAADVPVINGLSDRCHPCQLLADYLTLQEVFDTNLQGLRIVFVGDGSNNVVYSHLWACVYSGVELTVVCPPAYAPAPSVVAEIKAQGGRLTVCHPEPDTSIAETVAGAQVLYTDVWTSMGQEDETTRRKAMFSGYTITKEWLEHLAPGGIFMHDLPAHYGQECTEDVLYSTQSVVFDQAENRLHAHKGLLVALLADAVFDTV